LRLSPRFGFAAFSWRSRSTSSSSSEEDIIAIAANPDIGARSGRDAGGASNSTRLLPNVADFYNFHASIY
jgi:hypothetical protein